MIFNVRQSTKEIRQTVQTTSIENHSLEGKGIGDWVAADNDIELMQILSDQFIDSVFNTENH